MDWAWRALTSEIERERPQPSVSRCGSIQSKPTSRECLPKSAISDSLFLCRGSNPGVHECLRRAAARAVDVRQPLHPLAILCDAFDGLTAFEGVVQHQHPNRE